VREIPKDSHRTLGESSPAFPSKMKAAFWSVADLLFDGIEFPPLMN
jgi:hypothetical protein